MIDSICEMGAGKTKHHRDMFHCFVLFFSSMLFVFTYKTVLGCLLSWANSVAVNHPHFVLLENVNS